MDFYNEANGYGCRAAFVIDRDGSLLHVEALNTAIDPTCAYQVCDLLEKKLVVKPPATKP